MNNLSYSNSTLIHFALKSIFLTKIIDFFNGYIKVITSYGVSWRVCLIICFQYLKYIFFLIFCVETISTNIHIF